MTTEIVDVGQLVENIKSTDHPRTDISRLTQNRPYIPNELTRMIEEMVAGGEKLAAGRDKFVFFMNPNIKLRLADESPNTQYHEYAGHSIITHPDIPESDIFFMCPDIVGLTGEVYNQHQVVYLELTGDVDE